MIRLPLVAAALILATCATSWAQTGQTGGANDSLDPLQQLSAIGKLAQDLAPIIKEVARDHAIRSAQAATGNRAQVKSTDRSKKHKLHSPAHDRGAIDVVTPANSVDDALAISKQVGPHYTVTHERPIRNGVEADIHTTYQAGVRGRRKIQPDRATAEHIHIQPNFNTRLNQAAERLAEIQRRLRERRMPRQVRPTTSSGSATAPTPSSPSRVPPPHSSSPSNSGSETRPTEGRGSLPSRPCPGPYVCGVN
jgi:hypothetical protein